MRAPYRLKSESQPRIRIVKKHMNLTIRKRLLPFAVIATSFGVAQQTFAADELIPNGDFETATTSTVPIEVGMPQGWSFYQWGQETNNKFESVREAGSGRNGSAAIRATILGDVPRPGAYTHVKLAAGSYELSVWARTLKGQKAAVRIYLGNAYSGNFMVGDEWKQVKFVCTLSEPIEKAEINIQNTSGVPSTVYFDDVALQTIPGTKYSLVPDTRQERPRTLLFSPININYLKDSAALWAKRGFRGFMFDKVIAQLEDDIWATDGDAKTRGTDDKLLQELTAANEACLKVGIDSNFVKVAIYQETPDPFDDAAWGKITSNMREAARFARLSKCAGVAFDTEYLSMQFDPGWAGFAKNPHPLPELKAKIQERWDKIIGGMVAEFPEMVLLVLPEGVHVYGQLYEDLFKGMLSGMAKAKTDMPGGIHVLTEGTYHITDVPGLSDYVRNVEAGIEGILTPELMPYWKKHGSLAIGGWPFGYYRAIFDKDGKILGYAGRADVSGDKLIGSYADKSAWYTPEVFATQMAAMNSFSPRYNWIYGHGDVFTHLPPELIARYKTGMHQSLHSVEIPVAPNQEAYFEILAKPQLVKRED
jgi:hypothetical protein